ncbi:MAG: FAD-dependent hydroxylase [Leptolyngbyaceae cyanobacterium SL_5_9]|nr:FAD-dependent hydroxylase [Leptolyngbyaceae cyanobacterium SL_5_9]
MVLNQLPPQNLLATDHHSFAQSKTQVGKADRLQLDYDVAIVGGGIVGLTLASALKQSGLKIALIEAKPRTAGLERRRAYHVTLTSSKIFAGLGIWAKILPKITAFQQIHLADADYPAVVRFQPTDLGTEALGYVAEHRVLLQALQESLTETQVSWLCPAEVLAADYQPDCVTLTVSTQGKVQSIKTRLLVAADGTRSPMRQQAGIGTHGWQYWQSCVTAVIQPEKSHGNIAREHFWESGPFATLPLPDNRCQIVLTAPHAEAKALMELSKAEFLAELDRRYAGQLGRLTLVSDRLLFPVQLMHSDRYTLPRLALIGDAAHCCHPVGGQGLNMGIRDAAALAQVLQKAFHQGEDIGTLKVLKRYEHWRWLENLAILGFTDLLDRCFSTNWLPLLFSRRLGLRVMRSLRPLKGLALRLMTGLSGRLPDLAKPSL